MSFLSTARPTSVGISLLLQAVIALREHDQARHLLLSCGQAALSIGAMSARSHMISSTGALAPEPATPWNFDLGKRVGAQASGGVPVK